MVWAQKIASLGIWSRLFLSGSQKCLCWFCKLHYGFRSLNSVAESLAAFRTFGGLGRVHPKVPVIQWAALDASPDHGNTTWRGTSPRGFPHLTAQPTGTVERDSFSPATSWDSEANLSNSCLCNTAVASLCCSPSTQTQAEPELEGRLGWQPPRKGFLIKLQPLLINALGSCFLCLPF